MTHYKTTFEPVDIELMLERLGIEFVSKNNLVWISCPEHQERTPSCRIIDDPDDERHGQVRCYGCSWGGWPYRLVMSVLSCSDREARAWLKDVSKPPPVPFAIAIDYQQDIEKPRLTLPRGFVSKPLDDWSKEAREYAVEKRRLTDWQVIRWSIGYTSRKYDEKTNPKPGRIFIPVFDGRGRLVNYTGRTYGDSPARYLTAKKEDGADPASIFGEQYWPRENKRVAFVTEGAFDALACERAFPETPLAVPFGSQIHERHIRKIAEFDAVFIATDPDKAGEGAAFELEQKLKRWTKTFRLRLPAGYDCNKLEIKQPGRLRELLSELFNRYHGNSVDKRPRRKLKRHGT